MLSHPDPLRGTSHLKHDPEAMGNVSTGWHLLTQFVSRRLWWQWLMVSLVAGSGVEVLYQSLPRPSMTSLIASSSLRLLTIYVIVTILQTIVLRHAFKAWIGWMLGSLGGIVAVAVGLKVAGIDFHQLGFYAFIMQETIGPWGILTFIVVAVLVAVTSIGQALVLTEEAAHGGAWWVLACLTGVGGGLVVGMAWPLPVLGPFGTLGLVSGVVTATAISWLLPHDLDPEE